MNGINPSIKQASIHMLLPAQAAAAVNRHQE
jgi:hypothetical protein